MATPVAWEAAPAPQRPFNLLMRKKGWPVRQAIAAGLK
jgi:hypothetical protein